MCCSFPSILFELLLLCNRQNYRVECRDVPFRNVANVLIFAFRRVPHYACLPNRCFAVCERLSDFAETLRDSAVINRFVRKNKSHEFADKRRKSREREPSLSRRKKCVKNILLPLALMLEEYV